MIITKRLYQQIGLKLKDKISAGEFKVGDKLPPEREIAEQMEVSRSVVRESLIMLELQNIVKVRKGSGVFVVNTPDDAQKLMKEQHKIETDAEDDDDVAAVTVDGRDLLGIEERQVVAVEAERVCSIKTRRGGEIISTPIACPTEN